MRDSDPSARWSLTWSGLYLLGITCSRCARICIISDLFVTLNNINVSYISVYVFDFPTWVMMTQDVNQQNCPISNLPVSPSDFMFPLHGSFVRSRCEQEAEIQRKNCIILFLNELSCRCENILNLDTPDTAQSSDLVCVCYEIHLEHIWNWSHCTAGTRPTIYFELIRPWWIQTCVGSRPTHCKVLKSAGFISSVNSTPHGTLLGCHR